AHGMPILMFDKSSKGAMAYQQLAAEVIKQSPKKPAK
ncbi:MAG: ParA family protein, partial [Psychrobacter urativorans]